MSSERDFSPIQSDLEQVYEQYQQQHLYEELDDIADQMEETLLQCVIANNLFERSLSVSQKARDTVEAAQAAVQNDDVHRLEELIPEVETRVDEEETRINNEIQESRIEMYETVKAMRGLNEEIQVYNQGRLRGLETLLDDWSWKQHVYIEENNSYEERYNEAEEFATDMRSVFDDAKQAIGGEFTGQEIESLVDNLLNEGGVSFTELSPEQIQALADSEISSYLHLSLG